MILNLYGKSFINKDFIEKVAEAAFSYLNIKNGEIELEFVSKNKIKELNNTYRDKDYPTDVLSFTINERPLTGQIFICYNIAKEQALILNKSIEDEIALLLIHGILHLSGLDHLTDGEAEAMEIKEKEILKELGIER